MHHDTTTLAHYVPDLAEDKFHLWITKYHYLLIVALGLVLFAVGGITFPVVGHFSADGGGLACYLVGEFGNSHVGLSALFNPR